MNKEDVFYNVKLSIDFYFREVFCKKYGFYETKDTNLIFEDVVNVFKMTDKDKPHLWKLLTDFSIEEFLNNEQDPDFLYFLQYYDFYIKVCVNKQYL